MAAEVDAESSSESGSSSDSEDDLNVEEDDQLRMLAQLQQQQAQQQHARRRHRGQQDIDAENEDRVLVKTMLETLGFEKRYIEKALRVYEKNYGTGSYNPDDITQIILRLQDKEAMKKQKQELLAMNLDPKLAEEIFGNKYGHLSGKGKNKYGKSYKHKSKHSSKTSGFHSGDIIVYRDKILCQILDKLDEYLQVSWPITKPIYQRAILWANIDQCAKRSKKKEKELKDKSKFEDKFTAKENKKSSSIFSGIFGKGSSKYDDDGAPKQKHQYKFEKLWRDLVVDQFDKTADKVDDDEKKEPEIVISVDDDDEKKENDDKDKKSKKKKNKEQDEIRRTRTGEEILCEILKINGSSIKTEFNKQSSDKFDICSIYEVSNNFIEESYNKRKKLIQQFSLNGDSEKLNETKLWYSLSRDQVFKIINNGFRRKYGRSNSMGFGHKFYKNASDAIRGDGDIGNSYKSDSDNMKYLLYCSVIVGESCLGHREMKIPDQKPNKSYIMFETSVDMLPLDKNKYFIIFQDHQAIPLNIICIKQKQSEQPKAYVPKKPITSSSFGQHGKNRSYDFDPSIFLQHFNAGANQQQQSAQQQAQQLAALQQAQLQQQAALQQAQQQAQIQQGLHNQFAPFPPPQPQQQQQQQQRHRLHHQPRYHQIIPDNMDNNQLPDVPNVNLYRAQQPPQAPPPPQQNQNVNQYIPPHQRRNRPQRRQQYQFYFDDQQQQQQNQNLNINPVQPQQQQQQQQAIMNNNNNNDDYKQDDNSPSIPTNNDYNGMPPPQQQQQQHVDNNNNNNNNDGDYEYYDDDEYVEENENGPTDDYNPFGE